MISRNLPHHKTTKCTSKTQEHTHENPNAFMRRGASYPETFPVTRCTNTQAREKNTHARMSERLYEEESAWFAETVPISR